MKPDFRKATEDELQTIVASDEMAQASDIIAAKDELDRREVQR